MAASEKKQRTEEWKSLPTGGFFFVTFVFVVLLGSSFFSALDTRLCDCWSRWRLAAAEPAENPWAARLGKWLPKPIKPDSIPITLVLADDRAILGIPHLYEGNRTAYADVITTIATSGAKVIALDTFFGTSIAQTATEDARLADAVRNAGNVVLKAFRRGDATMTPPYPVLAKAGNVAPSYFRLIGDEKVRRASAVFKPAKGVAIPGFQLETARLWLGLQREDIVFEPDKVVLAGTLATRSFSLVDGEDVLINYNFDPQAITRVSMFDVLRGAVNPAVFKDRIVIIGQAHSLSEERLFTPLNRVEFPAFIHAVTVSNFLNGTLLTPSKKWQGPLLATVVLVIAAFGLAPFLQPLSFLLIALLGTLLLAVVSAISFTKFGRIVDVTAAITALDLTFIFAVGMRYYLEQSDKLRIKNAFQHYVTASVVNEILKDPTKLNLHGEERCLTIFFSDIEGFTMLSEGLSPFVVVNLLNEYLTEMTDIVFKYGGLLDKYEGDAIMAVFGAPIDQTDHAVRACRCAVDSQKALAKLRERWRSENKPELFVRIGINTGNVVVGNMGSRMRFDYTCIGDNVNLAARLETANKMFGSSILISGSTADLVQNFILCRFLGMLRVFGRREAVPVYEVLARLDDENVAFIEAQQHRKKAYEEALQAALNKNFEKAVEILSRYFTSVTEDKPAALLLERCRQYVVSPPPPDWDGIMVQEQK